MQDPFARDPKKGWQKELWGLKALWRKASRDPTKESAFWGFGGLLAELRIPFSCAFGNMSLRGR
jgi:hypothetical protein